MRTIMERFYKLARPDGWDFYTGKTINYRNSVGSVVSPPTPNAALGLCNSGLIHASRTMNDCFDCTATIPCSAYVVEGSPVAYEKNKYGFLELTILKELVDLDVAFGWRYTEAINLINPLIISTSLKDKHIKLLNQCILVMELLWDSAWKLVRESARDSLWRSVRDSLWETVPESVRNLVSKPIWNSIRKLMMESVWESVEDPLWDSLWDSLKAYIGYIFAPYVKKWRYIDHVEGEYPYQPAVDLWKDGFIPSFDGKTWRLHAGKNAEIVYER